MFNKTNNYIKYEKKILNLKKIILNSDKNYETLYPV